MQKGTVMRENAETKAGRLLIGGAVTVHEVSPRRVRATVQGDTDAHTVTFDANRWRCSCPSVGPSSHAQAVAKVVRVETRGWVSITQLWEPLHDRPVEARERTVSTKHMGPRS